MVMSPVVRQTSTSLAEISPFAMSPLNLPPSKLFGTDGIRGHVGELLNAPLALQVGFWAGQIFKDHYGTGAIALGQDSRNSSSMLAMALSAGLTAAGLEVWDLGLCPTPCVAYLAATSDAIGGVMISASHNPPADNGIKFFGPSGAKLPSEIQQRIEAGIRGQLNLSDINASWGRHHHRPELVKNYLNAVQTPLGLDLQGMKVVLDLAWGAASHVAPQAFAALGAEVICLHDRPDGDRINVNCGSTHLEPLRAAVLSHNACLGFAFDGDADRVLAVDGQGRAIDGDYILYLWGQALRQTGQLPDNLIVSTVMANLGFERAWEAQGGQLLRTSVGDQYVHAEMRRTGSTLGGEQSGHVICSHYGVSGDGLLTALHLAALVKRSGNRLSELVDESFQTYPQVLQNVRVEDRELRLNWQQCDPLQQAIATAETAMGDQGRVLVRASGTEPVIRVMVEAATSELVHHWTDNLVLAVRQHLLS
ncbi:MAG: phosphoglucosamine mutase, partial [Phormidium sp. GEM2.Bin31]